MILIRDKRYLYAMQLTKWMEHVRELEGVMEPFKRDYPHCVIRQDKRGRVAVFGKGTCTAKQRYKLEVIHGCIVVRLQK